MQIVSEYYFTNKYRVLSEGKNSFGRHREVSFFKKIICCNIRLLEMLKQQDTGNCLQQEVEIN